MKLFKKKEESIPNPADRIRYTQKKSYVLALANQKGGVGKTTTSVNLSAGLAALGARVLLVDMDPQGNASTGLGIEYAQRMNRGSYELLSGIEDREVLVTPTDVEGLDIITANSDLAGAEIELVDAEKREFRLQEALGIIKPNYDYVLIDCPPSLGLLTLNALVAADGVVVPLQCEFFALEGISHLAKTVGRIKEVFNPKLKIEGIVLTMYDRRNNLSSLVEADARAFFGNQVMKTTIARNVRISEAQSHGKPVMVYDSRSLGAMAYQELAAELLERITG